MVPALVVLAHPAAVEGGDTIQFSSPAPKPAPSRSSISAEKGGNAQGLGGLSSFNSAPSSGSGGIQPAPTSNRKSRQAEMERKNWMILEPGQLQGNDDLSSAFEGRSKQKEKSTADLWFSQKNGAPTRKPAPAPVAEEDIPEPTESKLGQGLNLKLESLSRLSGDSPAFGGPADAKRNALFGDAFRGGIGSGQPGSQNSRSEAGMRIMSSPASGSGESITFGLGINGRPSSIGTINSGGDSLARPSGPNLGLSADPGGTRPPGTFGTSLGNDLGSSRSRSGGFDNPSSLSSPLGGSSGGAFDSRAFRSTFDVPSRPR